MRLLYVFACNKLDLGICKEQTGLIRLKYKFEYKNRNLQQIFAEYSTAQWKGCVDHVIKIENQYLEKDRIADQNDDDMCRPFIIQLPEQTSSESSSDSESEKDSDEEI
ncbi:unnamed protein product [Chilo suppressalis]|uniref:Uncharacterized protein n=1 Tax=Chilo suppressalis TaxID=168631 RepID=A0ABN8AU80_CHISP|nr:unnamed protein product [Chilo suppressalis]